jgi:hypothetical protein
VNEGAYRFKGGVLVAEQASAPVAPGCRVRAGRPCTVRQDGTVVEVAPKAAVGQRWQLHTAAPVEALGLYRVSHVAHGAAWLRSEDPERPGFWQNRAPLVDGAMPSEGWLFIEQTEARPRVAVGQRWESRDGCDIVVVFVEGDRVTLGNDFRRERDGLVNGTLPAPWTFLDAAPYDTLSIGGRMAPKPGFSLEAGGFVAVAERIAQMADELAEAIRAAQRARFVALSQAFAALWDAMASERGVRMRSEHLVAEVIAARPYDLDVEGWRAMAIAAIEPNGNSLARASRFLGKAAVGDTVAMRWLWTGHDAALLVAALDAHARRDPPKPGDEWAAIYRRATAKHRAPDGPWLARRSARSRARR